MDNSILQSLIEEANSRGGGMILNFDEKPAAVVLSIEKYNELISNNNLRVGGQVFSEEGKQTSQALNFNTQSTKKNKILVTGGAGYIGAHTARLLLLAGYEVVVLDNLSSGKITNVPVEAKFVEGDLADTNLLKDLFATENFEAVCHFAASIEVEESVSYPEKYLHNNTVNSANLISVMLEAGVKKIIFSSTAAVYGEQQEVPILETAPVRPNNPYGFSKLLTEKIIQYHCQFSGLSAIVFRYFNACGSGFGGEILPTHESHLMPKVLEVAKGIKPHLTVFGNDYETPDGTCIRDYVHVLDIAEAHILALRHLEEKSNFKLYNIGTGKGISVLEIVATTSEVLGKIIPMEIGPKRPGDAPKTIANSDKIFKELGFKPKNSSLENIVLTSWQMFNK